MSKKLLLLNGLAILAVVSNHASGWGFTAMFWWTHRYLPVSVPNFDQLGSMAYYGLAILQKLTVFAVPSFLFVSGFFVAYAARGDQTKLNWKTVRARLKWILIPYLIWSFVIFLGNMIEGTRYSLIEYIQMIAFGGAVDAYFYIPVIIQLYVLAPFIVRFAKSGWKRLLVVSAIIQFSLMAFKFADLLNLTPLGLAVAIRSPAWFFGNWLFYFCLGVVFHFEMKKFKHFLSKFQWWFLILIILTGVMSFAETEWIYRVTKVVWGGNPQTLSSSIYAIAVIFFYLSFDSFPLPFEKTARWLGQNTYGIYLLHPMVLELVARGIYHVAPMILSHQFVLQPILISAGIVVPVTFMTIIAKSPARKVYRFLFG